MWPRQGYTEKDKISIEEALAITKISREILDSYLQKQVKAKDKKLLKENPIEINTSKSVFKKQDNYDVKLTNDKKNILTTVIEEGNIFLTGEPGTGKSYTSKAIINLARTNNIEIGVTAMTGTAALQNNGCTLHSFLGIGLAKGEASYLAGKVKKSQTKTYNKLLKLKALLIDEISMMNEELFNKISEFLSIIKTNPAPFGGIKLILVGDFCQIAPFEGNYCFNSDEWKRTNIKILTLTENIRQNDDEYFQKLLGRARWGKCTEEDWNSLEECKKTTFPNNIIPTKLFSKNANVDEVNNVEFMKLVNKSAPTREYWIRAVSEPCRLWATKCVITDISLCIGAQVMITRNIDIENGIVNGTRGIVYNFQEDYVTIKLINGNIIDIGYVSHQSDEDPTLSVKYIPLKLAWAISIHKSQGMTLDACQIDLGDNIFAEGQGYVALSRCKKLSNIQIINLSRNAFKTNQGVIEFYKNN